jgi:hypothetical protein
LIRRAWQLALLAGALAAPAPAAADFTIGAVRAAPADVAAGAHSDFTFHADFSPGGEHVRDFVVHMPPGVFGRLAAAPPCSRAAFDASRCPATSQLGRIGIRAQGAGFSTDAAGEIFNLVRSGSEPARLGIVLRPFGGALGTVRSEAVVSVRDSDFGLDTTMRDVTKTFLGFPIEIQSFDVMLAARAGVPAQPFMTNPTSCRPAITAIEVRTYEHPQTPVVGRGGFTPTGCDRLAYSPRVAASVQGVRAGGHPRLKIVIAQAPGQANTLRTAITLPRMLAPSQDALHHGCVPPDDGDLRGCPAQSVIGQAVVRSPVFSSPLTGPMIMVPSETRAFPDVFLLLGGPASLTVRAQTELTGTRAVRSSIPAGPDVPVDRIELTLRGGRDGFLVAQRNLCSSAVPMRVSLVSHSGARRQRVARSRVTGCPAPR